MSGAAYDGDDVRVKGNDGSDTGKLVTSSDDGSRHNLHVDAKITHPAASGLRFDDMNASTGGVARGTGISAATNVYSQTGSGVFYGFILTLEDLLIGKTWRVRLILDGNQSFSIVTDDLDQSDAYGLGNLPRDPRGLGFKLVGETLIFETENTYTTSIVIEADWLGTGSRDFLAGLVKRTV